MSKNIVIFADGTGQAGGLVPDERRSNIYKLYKAVRSDPESSIDPNEQIAFYDPGIGTWTSSRFTFGREIYNIVSQATGLGLTCNIVDCYSFIIKHWSEGDRIYLFGFSRGAYTVRCLAAVLSFCGIPRTDATGARLPLDDRSIRATAKYAVRQVYQHVSSPKETKYIKQRLELADAFRTTHQSELAAPYFIGVFDTVAAIAGRGSQTVCLAVYVVLFGILLGIASWFGYRVLPSALTILGVSLLLAGFAFLHTHLKFAAGATWTNFLKKAHISSLKMRFADEQLSQNVRFARHAISIDENRAEFARVPWANKGTSGGSNREAGDPPWLKQVWFAGNHSDIGGSYPEPESRLSDIALGWMIDEATSIPDGLSVNRQFLNLFPSPAGMQHDECKSSFSGRYMTQRFRTVLAEAPLHPSVIERFKLPEVLHFDTYSRYRPKHLSTHLEVKHFFDLEQGAVVPLAVDREPENLDSTQPRGPAGIVP